MVGFIAILIRELYKLSNDTRIEDGEKDGDYIFFFGTYTIYFA